MEGTELLTVREVEALTGVTVRALHYYDSIGLLPPDAVTDAGYRLYGRAALIRLQEIMFLRELEFPLKEIRDMLSSPGYDRRRALTMQRELLTLKVSRAQALVGLIDGALSENKIRFEGFKMDKINDARDKYRDEAKARWGNTEEYRQSEAKGDARTAAENSGMDADANAIFDAFAALSAAGADPAGKEARLLVERWQAHITRYYYECKLPVLKGLGQMYVADERFIANLDAHGAGTAQFMSDAIAAY